VWEGMDLQGVVVHTVSSGTHLWADGDLRADPGRGRYLPRAPFGHPYQGQL
jgi:dihydropyrimidinase